MLTSFIQLIAPIQFTFIPVFLLCALFLLYRTIWKHDKPAGLVLYLGLVIIVDRYLEQGIFLPFIEKGSIKYSEIVWFILFLKDKKLRTRVKSGFRKKVMFCFYCYIFLFLISALKVTPVLNGLLEFRSTVFPQLLAFVIAITGFEKDDDYILFFKYLLFLVGIMTFYLVWLLFNDSPIISGPKFYSEVFQRKLIERRYGSFFGNPNHLGYFIVLLFPVYIMLAISNRNKKYIFFVAIIMLIFMLAQTESRGPIMSCALSTLLLFLFNIRKLKKFFPLIIISFLLIWTFMPGILFHLSKRFQSEGVISEFQGVDQDRMQGRHFAWKVTTGIIEDNPFGIGLSFNKFGILSSDVKYTDGLIGTVDNPHNSYLEIAALAGLHTLLLFLILLGLILACFFKMMGRFKLDFFNGLFFAILGFCIGINTEPVMFRPQVANLFWVLLGLGVSLIEIQKRIESASSTQRNNLRQ